MRAAPVLLVLALAAPAAAQTDPRQDARSAMAACLSAVIDGAPVPDVKDGGIEIRRGREPESCTLLVSAGEPVVIREAVLEAINKRKERFSPARTRWDPGAYASRETFCNLPGRRALNVLVSTAKPGSPVALMATVVEADRRDPRCDRDEGLQKPALEG